MTLLLAVLLVGQGLAPLRKSDLVRLLSGAVLSQGELAQLVSRNCLTFDPTERDRGDLRRLGAERAVLAAMEECARRAAAARRGASATTPTVPHAQRTIPPAATPPPPPPPSRASAASAARSGFVAGGGQRGVVGARLPRALVFEVRDSLGAAIPGAPVGFETINARTAPDSATTDAAGQVRVGVTLGARVGSATVLAAVGTVEKQVAFNVAAGPAALLVVECGGSSLSGRFAIRPDSVVTLRVSAQDAHTNRTALLDLRAAVADARVFRVLRVAQDSAQGTVTLKPDQPGTTSLAVIANGLRQYLTVTVPPRAAPGSVDCR
jgi:hypothetical protein